MGTPLAGFGGSVTIGSSVAANISSWEAPLASDEYDTSSLGLGWKQYLPGLNGALVKVNAFFDPADTNGQVAMLNAWLNGTLITVKLNIGNSGHFFSGSAYIKQVDVKNPVNNVVTGDYDIQMTGQISYT